MTAVQLLPGLLLMISAGTFAASELMVYPNEGQDRAQQEQDEYQCYGWGKGESGFDPMAQPTAGAVVGGIRRAEVWDIMLNISWQFEVPLEHVQSGRTDESFRSNHPGSAPPIQVAYAKEKPNDAFVAVHAHEHWFYISQNDRRSKRVFSFLQLLLNLTEAATPDIAPVFTISN